jgi:hypothetical protein
MGIVESWEAMMSAIEKMRLLDQQNDGQEKERLEDWDVGGKGEWENINFSAGGLGRTMGKRLGMAAGSKKPSSLRKEEIL